MKTSLPGKKNLAGLDVFRVFGTRSTRSIYNGMDANTFAMSNTRHFLLLALCSLVVLVVVLVFKISLSFKFPCPFRWLRCTRIASCIPS